MCAAVLDRASSSDTTMSARPAAHSAGPNTIGGEAVSARDAVTHGPHVKETVPSHLGESQAEYDAFHDGLAREMRPRTAIEQHYIAQIAQSLRRLRRLSRWEAGLYDAPALTGEGRINRLARALRALRDGTTNCQNEPPPSLQRHSPPVSGPSPVPMGDPPGRQPSGSASPPGPPVRGRAWGGEAGVGASPIPLP